MVVAFDGAVDVSATAALDLDEAAGSLDDRLASVNDKGGAQVQGAVFDNTTSTVGNGWLLAVHDRGGSCMRPPW